MSWDQVPIWLFTSFVGALIVKLMDVITRRYFNAKKQRQAIADEILDYISQFAELVQLFRFHANYSGEVVQDDQGEILYDHQGDPRVRTEIFKVDPELEKAFSELEGIDVRGAINQRIVSISISSPHILDISLELDDSGELKESLSQLWIDTVHALRRTLERKDLGRPYDRFKDLINALEKADESRRKSIDLVNRKR